MNAPIIIPKINSSLNIPYSVAVLIVLSVLILCIALITAWTSASCLALSNGSFNGYVNGYEVTAVLTTQANGRGYVSFVYARSNVGGEDNPNNPTLPPIAPYLTGPTETEILYIGGKCNVTTYMEGSKVTLTVAQTGLTAQSANPLTLLGSSFSLDRMTSTYYVSA